MFINLIMFKNKKINMKGQLIMDKQLNTFFTSIGDNTIKNEITSMGIVERNFNLFNEGKFKVGNDSIYSMLGIKAPNQILSETRGFINVDKINSERKRLVDRILLPLANYKNLVEKSEPTKLDKKKTKEKNKSKVEPDHSIKKSDEKIRANAIRTTANRVLYPSLFVMSMDKSNFKFDKKIIRINLFCLKADIVKSVFSLDIENLKKSVPDSKVYFYDCNFSLLEKLTSKVLFKIEITKGNESNEQAENLELATSDATKGEFSESKADQMLVSIINQLNYLDDNEAFNQILKIQNHILSLDNYPIVMEEIVEPLRKQSKIKKDIYGSWIVDSANSIELEGNTIEELKTSFNKRFKIAV